MECVVCGEPITSPEQMKTFGLCDDCLEVAEENRPPSVADYWQQGAEVKAFLREYVQLAEVVKP